MAKPASDHVIPDEPRLKRALTLPLVVFYGLGVTIGAGIYVLIGATAGAAGYFAPVSFLLAAFVMTFSAASFAELCGRMPVSAGEAAYVEKGYRVSALSLVVGLMVVMAGIVSGATISIGCAGYIRNFVDVPVIALVVLIIAFTGAVAAVGIVQSVMFAAILTIIELGGLVAIVGGGLFGEPALLSKMGDVIQIGLDGAAWSGVLAAGLFAFFAFIGFEDMVNVAEEVEEPQRTMPRAIFLTLALTGAIYFLVAAVSVLSVPPEVLAASEAPLGLVFGQVTNLSPLTISVIAILATLNGMIIQMIMASRVIYGLADRGRLPGWLGRISPLTRTPLVATAVVSLITLAFAVLLPLEGLAQITSRITLLVFALVCGALIAIKLREEHAPEGLFTVPVWVPAVGIIANLMLLIFGS